MSDPGERAQDLGLLTYEQLVQTLEHLIERMAAGDVGIEEVVDLYEQAGRVHAEATARLERVRQRIEALAAQGREGQAGSGAT